MMVAHDGKGCLAEWDAHDRLDPRPDGLSTNPKGHASVFRAQCIALSGQCDAGKSLYRKALEQYGHSPETIDQFAQTMAADYCQGGQRSPRDELLYAWAQMGTARTAADCDAAYSTVKRLRPVVKPTDESDYTVANITKFPSDTIAGCFARTNDCTKAWHAFKIEEFERRRRDYPDSGRDDQALRGSFGIFAKCKAAAER
jgi:hypothetical protein